MCLTQLSTFLVGWFTPSVIVASVFLMYFSWNIGKVARKDVPKHERETKLHFLLCFCLKLAVKSKFFKEKSF